MAAVVASVAAVVAAGALVFGVVLLVRTMTALRLSIEALGRTTLAEADGPRPTVTAAVAEPTDEHERLEPVMFVPARVGPNPRLVYRACFSASPVIANPAIKAVALASGTARAAKALRHR